MRATVKADNSKKIKSAAKHYLESEKRSLRKSAAKFGTSSETLRTYLRKEGLLTQVSKGTDRARIKKERANKRWTPDEDSILKDAIETGFKVSEIMSLLGRSAPSIYCRKIYLTEKGILSNELRIPPAKGDEREKYQLSPEIISILEELEAEDNLVTEDAPLNYEVMKSESNSIYDELAQIVSKWGVSVSVKSVAGEQIVSIVK